MAGGDFEAENTARASERMSGVLPAAYDEKDDMDMMREKLKQKKKPILAGLALLCVVIIGISIAATAGGSSEANTSSGQKSPTPTPAPTTSAPKHTPAPKEDAGGVHAADDEDEDVSAKSKASSLAGSSSGASLESGVLLANSTETPEPTTETPSPSPEEPPLPYHTVDFAWNDASSWEYSSGRAISGGDMFTGDGIKLTPANSAEPIRSKMGWGGEKIVYVEWERSSTSDTNIWMLNTKIESQFGANNGWPYYGELDIFEMFTQDAKDMGGYDFSGFGGFGDVSSYGQLTLHNGPRHEDGQPCFCPSSASKRAWFKNVSPMTSGCTAQFANTEKNSMATVWGRDGNGQFLQLIQNPTITEGGKLNEKPTYDISGGSTTTSKIYNNADLFWGTPSSAPCAAAGGHNPNTGFPFFEDFRLILEEQKKNDGSAWFKVTDVKIFYAN